MKFMLVSMCVMAIPMFGISPLDYPISFFVRLRACWLLGLSMWEGAMSRVNRWEECVAIAKREVR